MKKIASKLVAKATAGLKSAVLQDLNKEDKSLKDLLDDEKQENRDGNRSEPTG